MFWTASPSPPSPPTIFTFLWSLGPNLHHNGQCFPLHPDSLGTLREGKELPLFRRSSEGIRTRSSSYHQDVDAAVCRVHPRYAAIEQSRSELSSRMMSRGFRQSAMTALCSLLVLLVLVDDDFLDIDNCTKPSDS